MDENIRNYLKSIYDKLIEVGFIEILDINNLSNTNNRNRELDILLSIINKGKDNGLFKSNKGPIEYNEFIYLIEEFFKSMGINRVNKEYIDNFILSIISFNLNYKTNIAKKNIHFKDMLNSSPNRILDSEVTDDITKEISRYVIETTKDIPNMRFQYYDLRLQENTDYKDIIYAFFNDVTRSNPIIMEKVRKILEEDIIIDEDNKRAVTSNGKIHIGSIDSLNSLVTLAHEVSHAIRSDKACPNILKEVESLMTESLFTNYLISSKRKIFKDINGDTRELTNQDVCLWEINKIKQNIGIMHRSLDELSFIELYKQYGNITPKLLNSFCQSQKDNSIERSTGILGIIESASNIKNIIGHYFSNNPNFNYNAINTFDSANGQHLSNEARFIYGSILSNYILNKYRDNRDGLRDFYTNYLNKDFNNLGVFLTSFFDRFSMDNIKSYINQFISHYLHTYKDVDSELIVLAKQSEIKRAESENNIDYVYKGMSEDIRKWYKDYYQDKENNNRGR